MDGWKTESTKMARYSPAFLQHTCSIVVPSSSFPTPGQRAFQSMWSSWPSCSYWVQQPSRLLPTTAWTLPPGSTATPTATSLHCASEQPMERSWHTKTHTTSLHCTTGVRWETQIRVTVNQQLAEDERNMFVFLCSRCAQDKRGQCWNLTHRCPTRFPYSTLLCLILGMGTRSLVSKSARFATMVSQASGVNLITTRVI